MTMKEVSTLVPPQQSRSRATLARLLAATERLLERMTWEELTIAHLVEEAGSSVGSFYTRFADKDALINHLDTLYEEQIVQLFDQLSERCGDAELGLDAKMRDLTHSLSVFYSNRRGVARALVLRARTLREPAFDQRTARMNRAIDRFLTVLRADRALKAHPKPEAVVFLAFSIAFSTLRERLLFPETIQSAPREELDAATEIAGLLTHYLTQ